LIDLHSHILPGIDDGAKDMAMALAMARIAVSEHTTHIACTPHFMPGVYDNTVPDITAIISSLENALAEEGIDLKLVRGGDIHIAPDISERLTAGSLPALGSSHYFLFEPPHHVLPPGILKLCEKIMKAGYTPVLTHPERLTWIEKNYEIICKLDEMGLVIQLTAGSITGTFGKRAKYWSERMLEEGRVDIIASDAHNTRSRPPGLIKAHDTIAKMLGDAPAKVIVHDNPQRILDNLPMILKSRNASSTAPLKKKGFFARIGLE